MWRGNPLWRAIESDAAAVAILQGPQAYVHPGRLAMKRETGKAVPTWNHVAPTDVLTPLSYSLPPVPYLLTTCLHRGACSLTIVQNHLGSPRKPGNLRATLLRMTKT